LKRSCKISKKISPRSEFRPRIEAIDYRLVCALPQHQRKPSTVEHFKKIHKIFAIGLTSAVGRSNRQGALRTIRGNRTGSEDRNVRHSRSKRNGGSVTLSGVDPLHKACAALAVSDTASAQIACTPIYLCTALRPVNRRVGCPIILRLQTAGRLAAQGAAPEAARLTDSAASRSTPSAQPQLGPRSSSKVWRSGRRRAACRRACSAPAAPCTV
jgi:hypothetical protein